MELDDFTKAYIIAALWSSNDTYDPETGLPTDAPDGQPEPLDGYFSIDDIAPDTLARMAADCERFQRENEAHLVDENCLYDGCPMIENAGHDFWLTRCGHGCGFWDGDWTEPSASILTAASEAFGNVDLYVGDDGRIYS